MVRWGCKPTNLQQTWLPPRKKKKKIRLTKRHDAALQRGLARDELFLAVHRVVTTPSYGEGEFHHIYGLVYQG